MKDLKRRNEKVFKLTTIIIVAAIVVGLCSIFLGGCAASIESDISDMKGSITGNTYTAEFYTNNGEKYLQAEGTNIDINSNIVKEETYDRDSGWGYVKTVSSVITITIDGSQIESCGSTVIFSEKGLTPDVDFQLKDIKSKAEDFGDYTFIANIVNEYKNWFGKGTVVVIQSQLGDPICAYSGDKVYWEVCEDLPKTTKLMVDGKALYIHRANFVIIDKDLIK